MKDETFVDKVKRQFGYLEKEYDFKMIFASDSRDTPRTDGIVKYASNSTLIIIDGETGQVSLKFLRVNDDENYYLDPVSIHEYLSTTEKEKQILLSREKKDKENATAILNKTFLLASLCWLSSREDIDQDLENRLENYSNWLRSHANLSLIGDFSQWPNFYAYKIERQIANELRSGGTEVVRAVVRDENGALKTVERPIFQREMDHLAKLKKEIANKQDYI